MSAFGEYVDLTANLASILRRYPFGIGVFREIIQNSEDAGATKQIFILDHRDHSRDSLIDDRLAHLQNAAFLAYNDAVFSDADWKAIQTVSQSSKTSDPEKIGKHGLGSRAYYHFTDNPQYLSGGHLAMFDPRRSVFQDGGWKMSVEEAKSDYPNQLEPFAPLMNGNDSGTIVRLPLRIQSSQISSETPSASAIRELLVTFIHEELHIVLLFLSQLKSIEVKEIDLQGQERVLATAVSSSESLDIEGQENDGTRFALERRKIHVTYDDSIKPTVMTIAIPMHYEWFLLRASFPMKDVIKKLTDNQTGHYDDVGGKLDQEKLRPNIGLAFPTSSQPFTFSGRLFTFLPLPLPTGLPCHIHGVFALTDARQNLRNPSEAVLPGTPDALAVEWNKLLFDSLIPRAWLGFLQAAASSIVDLNVYQALPPFHNHHTTGDAAYWSSLLNSIVNLALDRQSQIWPVFTSGAAVPQTPTHTCLEESFVASEGDNAETLCILMKAGVTIIMPPRDICTLLLQRCPSLDLTPESVHCKLTVEQNRDRIAALQPSERSGLLEFLLRSGNLMQLVDVPVMTLTSGELVALRAKASGPQRTHVLMDEADAELFGDFEPDAVKLNDVPPNARTLLLAQGNVLLNVEPMTCSRSIGYIQSACQRFALHGSPAGPTWTNVCVWLNKFWIWMLGCSFANDLLAAIRSLPILPTVSHDLCAVEDRIFLHTAELSSSRRDVLSRVGITFLDPSISPTFLEQTQLVRSVSSAIDLLDALQSDPQGSLDDGDAHSLRAHLASTLVPAVQLTIEQKAVLRSLPIHPTLTTNQELHSESVRIRIHNLLPNHESPIYCISDIATISLPLPEVADADFVHCTPDERPLLEHLVNPIEPLTPQGILQLHRRYIMEQSPATRLHILEFLVDHPYHQTPTMMHTLGSSAIVLVGEDTDRRWLAPRDIIDPNSSIANLVSAHDVDSVVQNDTVNSRTVLALSTLHLFRRTLDDDYVGNRITHIASLTLGGLEAARLLLSTLDRSWYNCSRVEYDPELLWIPTGQGMKRPRDCRDASQRVFCDRVLPLLDIEPLRSPLLRRMLRWDEPVPLDIVIRQFRLVISEPHQDVNTHRMYLVELICEFGRRLSSLTSAQLDDISAFARSKEWVPTRGGELKQPSFAVLELHSPLRGFGRVSYELTEPSHEFLLRVGCATRPLNSAIIDQLVSLNALEPLKDCAIEAMALLLTLNFATLSDDERTSLLAPGSDCRLHPVERLFYNDIGPRANSLEVPTDRVRVHRDMSVKLCRDLRVPSMGSLNLTPLDFVAEEMREDLTTRIRNVLKAYDIKQAFNEFLANAADAGAKTFDVMLDDENSRQAHCNDVLCEAIAEFCTGPALVVHNDAKFTQTDIQGICRVGRGGKEARDSTIGQFGLGSLTFYHFSEVAMILTGSYLLLLDPSGCYLPDRNAHVLALENIRRVYPGHLQLFDGLFGFNTSDNDYRGTIIRLPLRTRDQATRSSLSQRPCSTVNIRSMLKDYRSIASRSLFFVNVNEITAWESRHSTPLWSVLVRREDEQSNGTYESQHLHISVVVDTGASVQRTNWRVLKTIVDPNACPSELQSVVPQHQSKQLSVALAAELPSDAEPENPTDSYHFSFLPLPITTSLPAHVHASFILASDRRTVRWDGDGNSNPVSRFNHWLLSTVVPPLFLALVESWTPRADADIPWPGSRDSLDTMSQTVIHAFYSDSCLVRSSRKIFRGLTGRQLPPPSAVICDVVGTGPVRDVLRKLGPEEMVELPPRICSLVLQRTSMRRVDGDYVREVVSRMRDNFVGAFRSNTIAVPDIERVVRCIMDSDRLETPNKLLGLPLLPLADDSLADIEGEGRPDPILVGPWKDLKPWPLFPPHRFLHSSFHQQLLLNKGFNIASFQDYGVSLLAGKLSRASRRESVSTEDQDWIFKFWELFTAYKLELDDLKPFPLIPTIDDDIFISLDAALSLPSISLPSSETDRRLTASLQSLGAIVVRQTWKKPSAVRQALKKSDLEFNFKRVLQVLHHLHAADNNIETKFENELSDGERQELATWLRTSLNTVHVGPPLVDTLRHLPIWPAFRGKSYPTLHVLTDPLVRILPSAVQSVNQIALFLRPELYFVEGREVSRLSSSTPQMSTSDFIHCLTFPHHLRNNDILSRYESLLENVLRLTFTSEEVRLQVPNEGAVMISVRSLYKSDVPEFRAAFSKRPDNFLHPRLRSFEGRLVRYGLCKDITPETFKACIQAIDEGFDVDSEEDRDTSLVVFRCYMTRLPKIVTEDAWWRELYSYTFIPRHSDRRLGGSNSKFARFASPNTLLVSPRKVLRHEYSAVAWTQRALFSEAPDKLLFMADQSLGVPTVEEVVKHLLVLTSKVAQHYPRDCEVIKDIEATYVYLNARHEEAKTYLLRNTGKKMFLNVNDPTKEWKFYPASQIMFNIPDEGDRVEVRAFLRPFRSLLLASGAEEIVLPEEPVTPPTPAEEELSRLREAFNELRAARLLTDVVFRVKGDTEDSSEGQLWAHRTLLSAASEHFRRSFSGGLAESGPASSENPIVINLEGPHELECAELILNHIYTGSFDEKQDRDCLIELLLLANCWEIGRVRARAEALLVKTLTPGTYRELRDYAKRVEAQMLLEKIEEFVTQNAFALGQME